MYWLIIAAIVYLIFKYAIFIVMPFLIGFAIAAMLSPLVRFLGRRFGMGRRPTAILILLIFYATIGMLVTILIVRLAVWAGEFSSSLPRLYSETIEPMLSSAIDWINKLSARFDDHMGDSFTDSLGGLLTSVKTSLGNAVSDISVKALSALSGFAARIPRFVIELVFAVISSFFIIIDYESILEYVKSRLPDKTVGMLTELRDRFFVTILKYLRSYALIMLITFVELTVGLFVLGVENAAMCAMLIALFDVLPVLGTGGIMIPWAVIELIRRHFGRGVGLLVVWAIITIVRNIIEPRIVGQQVGLHPLVTLAAMFIGTKLFGLVGLILLPVGLAIGLSVLRERENTQKSNGS